MVHHQRAAEPVGPALPATPQTGKDADRAHHSDQPHQWEQENHLDNTAVELPETHPQERGGGEVQNDVENGPRLDGQSRSLTENEIRVRRIQE